MSDPRTPFAAAATAVLLLCAACGEEDPGVRAYKDRVERRCERYQDERKAAGQRIDRELFERDPKDLSPAELRRVAPGLRAVQRATARVVADLKALPRPEAARAELAKAFRHADAGVASEAAGVRAAARGDGDAMVAAFAETGEEFSAANRAGESYGLKACG